MDAKWKGTLSSGVDNELKETVMEKLDLTDVPNSLEWEDLQVRMREKEKRLGWEPGFTTPLNEADEEAYDYTIPRTGQVLKEEDFIPGLIETTPYGIQEHGRYQAEALAFLEIFKPAREGGGSPDIYSHSRQNIKYLELPR